ncbi:uncharacterized protein N7498_007667 [Penicillium cinerascens]|uniref:Uncharacterized protein n=1 Tax=Penicillium cinerascens TaxID=70096 RepID=A0A9W9MDK6_9EURO|nr:uncharacterized protein N7498_007667 [Penicillium cinerascens]KAJ5198550.1 hypothetical protein N7498_007667 [Penicillium cinerascens]
MSSFVRFLVATTLLVNASAFPLHVRDAMEWNFDLFPTARCNGTGNAHTGSGSTGCRANLPTEAAAYRLNSIADGCRIQLFDNTMCDESEMSIVPGPLTTADTCRFPGSGHRYGSYQVTCDA